MDNLENKDFLQKEYTFQEIPFKLKRRSLKARKESYLLLAEFYKYAKLFGDDLNSETLGIAIISYLSDEDKLKELFSKALDGDVDKIDYDCEDDEKYIQLSTFASSVFTDFFSFTSMLQTKTLS